jgi:hypothetical protein
MTVSIFSCHGEYVGALTNLLRGIVWDVTSSGSNWQTARRNISPAALKDSNTVRRLHCSKKVISVKRTAFVYTSGRYYVHQKQRYENLELMFFRSEQLSNLADLRSPDRGCQVVNVTDPSGRILCF